MFRAASRDRRLFAGFVKYPDGSRVAFVFAANPGANICAQDTYAAAYSLRGLVERCTTEGRPQ
jgi:hypothetical protein